jgi:hypothetical protein
MPLTFFEPKASTGSGDTPFLNEWIEKNPKNKETQFLVKEIKKVTSGKGYLVVCDDFQGFIWSNQKLTKLLIEALEIWINESKDGYALFLILSKPNKPEFTLACDKDIPVTWFASKNGFTTTASDAISHGDAVVDGNPFL